MRPVRPFPWINRDGKVIIVASGVRSFGSGFAVVVLGVYLSDIGFSLGQIGLFFTAGVAGSALLTFATGLLDGRVGRRTLLLSITLIQAVPAAGLVMTDNFAAMAAASFIGAIGGTTGRGPVQPLEQASLAVTSVSGRRTGVFAVYRIAGTGAAAIGSLAAGLTPLIAQGFGIDDLTERLPEPGCICPVRLARGGVLAGALLLRSDGRADT